MRATRSPWPMPAAIRPLATPLTWVRNLLHVTSSQRSPARRLNTTLWGAWTALSTTMSLRLPVAAAGASTGEVYSSTIGALLVSSRCRPGSFAVTLLAGSRRVSPRRTGHPDRVPALDIADDTFVARAPEDVAAAVADALAWARWWPDLRLAVT